MASKQITEAVSRFVTELHALVDAEVRANVQQKLLAAVTTPEGAPVAKRKTGYSYTFEAKPCPTCGKMNKGRRWRYFCKEHMGASATVTQ